MNDNYHLLIKKAYLFFSCSVSTSLTGLDVDWTEFVIDSFETADLLLFGLIPTNLYIVYKNGFFELPFL
jgi:hypothetical protein